MRRMMILVILAAAAAGCGDEASTPDGESDMREPSLVVCEEGIDVRSQADLEAFGARGCQSLGQLGHLNLRGEDITTLEPLRALRSVAQLTISETSVRTLEPLRDVEEVSLGVTIERNALLSNCEVTGWAADVAKRDGNGIVPLTLDDGKNPNQCPTWAYPER